MNPVWSVLTQCHLHTINVQRYISLFVSVTTFGLICQHLGCQWRQICGLEGESDVADWCKANDGYILECWVFSDLTVETFYIFLVNLRMLTSQVPALVPCFHLASGEHFLLVLSYSWVVKYQCFWLVGQASSPPELPVLDSDLTTVLNITPLTSKIVERWNNMAKVKMFLRK